MTETAHPVADALLLADRGRPASALERARTLFDDAVARNDRVARAQAAAALAWLSLMLSQTEEGLAFARMASHAAQRLALPETEARARACAAWLMVELSESKPVEEARRSLAVAERSGSTAAIAFSRNALGICLYALQQPDLALAECMAAADSARADGDPVNEGRYLTNAAVAQADLADRDPDPAQRHARYQEAAHMTRLGLDLCGTAGDSWGARISLCNLAEYTLNLARPAEARALLDRHSVLDGELGDRDLAHLDHTLSLCLVAEDLFDEAETALHRCIERCRRTSFLQIQLLAERDLAALLARRHRFEEAYAAHGRFHALYVSRSADGAQRRARALALQHDIERLAASNQLLTAQTAQLLRESLEDPLTGLPNRRALDAALAAVGDDPFALAMIDIDRFKRINDERTHVVGDQVLRELGRLVCRNFPPPAFAARFGGEEFTALLPGADAAAASASCEALRRAVEDHDWGQIQPGLAVTISIGVAVGGQGDTMAALLHLADQRLYGAKRLGRNRVEAGLLAGSDRAPSRLRLASGGS